MYAVKKTEWEPVWERGYAVVASRKDQLPSQPHQKTIGQEIWLLVVGLFFVPCCFHVVARGEASVYMCKIRCKLGAGFQPGTL